MADPCPVFNDVRFPVPIFSSRCMKGKPPALLVYTHGLTDTLHSTYISKSSVQLSMVRGSKPPANRSSVISIQIDGSVGRRERTSVKDRGTTLPDRQVVFAHRVLQGRTGPVLFGGVKKGRP